MRILVTGGAGFIGSCFIRYILNKYPKYKIFNLDALTYCGNLDNLLDIANNSNYEFVLGNICNREIVGKLFKKVDCVINFAAESHVDNSIMNPNVFVETNVLGTLNLLQELKKHKNIQRFLQISTDEVYGTLGETGSFTEESPLLPNSPYSASKASADLLARAFCETYNLPILITRCTNNYGPFQYPEKLIPCFISKLLKNEKVPVYGDGLNIRDWLYVYDHCSAIDLVLHKGRIGEIYNIGSNNEKTNLEMTQIILNILDKDSSYIEFVQDRLGHDKRYALSSDKIRTELGWKPSVTFEEGIKNTITWYLNNEAWLKALTLKNKKEVIV